MLSVVVPTIVGREDSLERTLRAYQATGPEDMQIVVVRDRANWPAACNRGYKLSAGEVIHFSADDIEPLPGWWQEVLPYLEEHDELPAPKVLNHSADGEWDNAIDGPNGATPHFTRVPIMTRSQYKRIGAWPEIDYGADVWVSERGRALGIETRMFHSYAFVHHWNQVGRIDTPERLRHSEAQLNAIRAKGYA